MRLQSAIEHKISKTQYGFRPGRSTAHALYIIRMIQDYSEQKHATLNLALLDWEKAFDKLKHDKMYNALGRLGIHEHIIKAIQNCYSNPRFFVRDEYNISATKLQKAGIRQGCPLSPHLFILVMTCIDNDIDRSCSNAVRNARLPNVDFHSIYYADDTIIFSMQTRALNEILAHV